MKKTLFVSVLVVVVLVTGCNLFGPSIPNYKPTDAEIETAFVAVSLGLMTGMEEIGESGSVDGLLVEASIKDGVISGTITFTDYEVEMEYEEDDIIVILDGDIDLTMTGNEEEFSFKIKVLTKSDAFGGDIYFDLEFEVDDEEEVDIKRFRINGVDFDEDDFEELFGDMG